MDPQQSFDPKEERLNKIPHNVIASVADQYASHDACYHLLVLNRHTLVVQAPKIDWNYHYAGDPGIEDAQIYYDVQINANIQIIASLLHTVAFLQHRWLYLVPLPKGQYRLVPRKPTLYRFTCPTWAPLIPEEEIEITGYAGNLPTLSYGIWKGREVDVLSGFENWWLEQLDRESVARRALRDLDLTFGFLGHLTRDGEIVGFVLEAPKGRYIEYRDRSKVYQAFAKLLQNNIVWAGPTECNIMIYKGKVRFLRLNTARVYSESNKAEMDEGSQWYWFHLDRLFNQLATRPNDAVPPRLITTLYAYTPTFCPTPNPLQHITPVLLCYWDRRLIYLLLTFRTNKESLICQRSQRKRKGESVALFEWLASMIGQFLDPEDRKLLTSSHSYNRRDLQHNASSKVDYFFELEERKPLITDSKPSFTQISASDASSNPHPPFPQFSGKFKSELDPPELDEYKLLASDSHPATRTFMSGASHPYRQLWLSQFRESGRTSSSGYALEERKPLASDSQHPIMRTSAPVRSSRRYRQRPLSRYSESSAGTDLSF